MKNIDIGFRPGVLNYDGYMLMKFTPTEQFRQDFLDGRIYFNTSDYFAGCKDAGRGDRDEGKTFIINPEKPAYVSANLGKIGETYAIIVRDYSAYPEEYIPSTILDYSSAINRDRKILSLYTVYVDLKGKKISPFAEKMKDEFGEFGILILDRQEFFKRIYAALTKNNLTKDAYMGFVEYLPKERQEGLMDWHPFIKKDCFNYQNEFRITFVSNDSEAMLLDIGRSLRDIAVPINITDLNEIHFEGENLLYPVYDKE